MRLLSAQRHLLPPSAGWRVGLKWKQGLLAVCVTAFAMLGMPTESQAFWGWFGCHKGGTNCFNRGAACGTTPTTTTAACNPCGTTTCGTANACVTQYVPQVSFRRELVTVPTTAFRPATSCDPCTGCPVTTLRPVTMMTTQVQMVPYTTYRIVNTPMPMATTVGFAAVPAVSTGCSSCNSCGTGALPATGTLPTGVFPAPAGTMMPMGTTAMPMGSSAPTLQPGTVIQMPVEQGMPVTQPGAVRREVVPQVMVGPQFPQIAPQPVLAPAPAAANINPAPGTSSMPNTSLPSSNQATPLRTGTTRLPTHEGNPLHIQPSERTTQAWPQNDGWRSVNQPQAPALPYQHSPAQLAREPASPVQLISHSQPNYAAPQPQPQQVVDDGWRKAK